MNPSGETDPCPKVGPLMTLGPLLIIPSLLSRQGYATFDDVVPLDDPVITPVSSLNPCFTKDWPPIVHHRPQKGVAWQCQSGVDRLV